MPKKLSRLCSLALSALVLLTLAPTVSAADELSIPDAERRLARLLNDQRATLGLRPLRLDHRLRDVAHIRVRDMATKHYFAHQHSDGRYAWDIMSDEGINWYWAGEILAWNNYGTLRESTDAAARGWRESPTHWAIVKDPDYNYFHFGYAYDKELGRKIWAGIFLKGPDRTGAWSEMEGAGVPTAAYTTSSTSRQMTVRWAGADVPLSVLTSGFRYFIVQRRTDGGSWTTLLASTTATSFTGNMTRGHRYDFRVRGRDRAGNYGRWSDPLVVTP